MILRGFYRRRLSFSCQRAFLWLLLFSFLMIGVLVDYKNVFAEEVTVQNLRQEDLNGDGQPDLTVLTVDLQTPFDEVRIYDGAGNMSQGTDWQSTTDFEDDTWLFDTLADDTAQLIIQFERVGSRQSAKLFTDLDGDTNVDYELAPDFSVIVTESPSGEQAPDFAQAFSLPSLTAVADGGWFLPDGQLNWNVYFLTDGPVTHIHTYNLTDIWNRNDFIKLDGKPDIELQFSDQERDGIPEYGLWRLLSPTPGSWGATRTWLWANLEKNRPQPQSFIFWPYLTSRNYQSPLEAGHAGVSTLNYFDVPPAISIAFGSGLIRSFFFPGYPIEEGYHINSLEYFRKGNEPNYANFENAQAYYDLAADDDGAPELHIRHRYFRAKDPYGGDVSVPVNEIRWSWNQQNTDGIVWDYKLGLAGRHPITTTMNFADFSYLTIPFEEFPTWVTSNEWDIATFVANEQSPQPSTEGIYLWGAVEASIDGDPEALTHYLGGEVAVDIDHVFGSVIAAGWRGDFAPTLHGQPILYFSPIDHKLHLFKGTHGVWNIDDRFALRYADLDRDGYIDQWQHVQLPAREEEGAAEQGLADDEGAAETVGGSLALTPALAPQEPQEFLLQQLNYASGYLILATEGQILLQPATPPLSLFETLPPSNHEEWLALGEQLRAAGNQEQGADEPQSWGGLREGLQGMMAQFEGPVSQIEGATLRDFRTTKEGFRFILELQAGASISDALIPEIATLNPGEYVVTYDGSFTIHPFTPASLSLSVQLPTETKLTPYEPAAVRISASNSGLEDAKGLTLVAEAHEGEQAIELTHQRIDVLSENTTFVTLDWQANYAGEWIWHIWLEDQEENRLAELSYPINVSDDLSASEEQSLLALLTGAEGAPFSISALVAFSVSMILALYLVGRHKEEID